MKPLVFEKLGYGGLSAGAGVDVTSGFAVSGAVSGSVPLWDASTGAPMLGSAAEGAPAAGVICSGLAVGLGVTH